MGADRITQGPLNSVGTNPYDSEALVLDALNNILSISGNSKVLTAVSTLRQNTPAQPALTAITAAQVLWSKLLNAGELNLVGRTYTLSGYGIYTSPGTTTPTFTFVLSLGGVTLATITTTAVSAVASTNLPFQFNYTFTVVSVGANGTLEVHGEVDINLSANNPAAALSRFPDVNNAVSGAVNLLTADTLQLTIAASSTITSAQLRSAYLQVQA
jgi:hypothetical protein